MGKIDALKWLVLHSSGCLLCVFSVVFILFFSVIFILFGFLTHLSTDAIRHGAVRQNYACIMNDAIAQCVIITWNMAFVDYFDSRNWSLSTQSPSYDSHLISINFIQMYSLYIAIEFNHVWRITNVQMEIAHVIITFFQSEIDKIATQNVFFWKFDLSLVYFSLDFSNTVIGKKMLQIAN